MRETEARKVVWIGPLLEERELEELIKAGECATASANLAEWNFLKTMVRECDVEITALSAIRTIEFPKNRKLYYPTRVAEKYLDNRLTLKNVGFCNIFGISHIARQSALVSEARRIAQSIEPERYVVLFVYSMHLPFMRAAAEFKKHHPNCCYKLIVPDLPLNMNTSTGLRAFLKRIDWENIQKQMPSVDSYVLYTAQMAQYLRLSKENYSVCEGIANPDLLKMEKPVFDTDKVTTCVYAGNLDSKYKIENLVRAFGEAGIKDAILKVYGTGSGENRVKQECELYDNTYFGGFKSNEEIVRIEFNASLVLNPRPTDLNCAEYSCPSKTLEAMALGVAMASSNLGGIPSEYWEYLIPIKCDTVEELKDSLVSVINLSKEELHRKGANSRVFIENRSNEIIRDLLDSTGDTRK